MMEAMWILYILNTEGGIHPHGEFFTKEQCMQEKKADEKENDNPSYVIFSCQRASVWRQN